MRKQVGFSIVMAIFILVVLSLLGSYMVKLSGVQHATSTFAIQGARTYQAARAGIEWGIYKVTQGSCVGTTTISTSGDYLSGFDGYTIVVTCTKSVAYNEGDLNSNGDLTDDDFYVYSIVSKANYGNYSGSGYIYRAIEVSIVD